MPTTQNKLTIEECDALLTQKGSYFETEAVVIGGRRQKVWKNAPPTIRDFLVSSCKQYADRDLVSTPIPEPADFHARETLTYGEVYKRALDLAAVLRGMGVGMGDRVAIGGVNSGGWIITFVAVNLLGAVSVTLNSSLTPEVTVHCLGLTKPKVVLVDEGMASTIAPLKATLESKKVGPIYCWSSVKHLPPHVHKGVQDIANFKPQAQHIHDVEVGKGLAELGPESDALIMFTSGTTNLPKAVLSTQRAAMCHVPGGSVMAARHFMRAGYSLEETLAMATVPPPEQGVMLIAVPLFHVTGLLGWMARAFLVGFKIVFMRRWSVPDAVNLVVQEKIGFIGGVPSIVTSIMQSPLLPENHVFSGMTYGGAAAPKRLAGDVAERWPQVLATHAWGMTETNGLHTAVMGDDYIRKPETVGHTMPISETKIVDADTLKDVGPGHMGIIFARGPNLMKCYVDNPKATAEAIDDDGWLNTDDMGYIDADGDLFIRDRAKDIIIRGGENIASAEVENAIFHDKRIAECAAVPVPDPVLGERVGVAVSLAPGASATPESVIADAEPRLRYPARPAIVVILPELPRNANGKIVKSDVKKIVVKAWEDAGGAKSLPSVKARL